MVVSKLSIMGAVRAIEGDITALDVDAVVNAANEYLQHGGGVAAAISRAAGPSLQAESDAWVVEHGPVEAGSAAVTTGGELRARLVVHVVGPRYRQGQDNEGLLVQAVTAALDAAAENGARTVAMPAISAGIFGYPKAEATAVIANAARAWLSSRPEALDEILLVGYDRETFKAFDRAL